MRYFTNAKYDKSLGLWQNLEFMAKVGIAHHKKAQYDTMKQRKTQKIPKYFSIFFFFVLVVL